MISYIFAAKPTHDLLAPGTTCMQ